MEHGQSLIWRKRKPAQTTTVITITNLYKIYPSLNKKDKNLR